MTDCHIHLCSRHLGWNGNRQSEKHLPLLTEGRGASLGYRGHRHEQTFGSRAGHAGQDRKSTRLNSSHGYISYAVFCLKKKKTEQLVCIPSDTVTTVINASHTPR